MELLWGALAGVVVGFCLSALLSWAMVRSTVRRSIEAQLAPLRDTQRATARTADQRHDAEIRILQAQLVLAEPAHSTKQQTARAAARTLLLLCTNLVHTARHGTPPHADELSRFRSELLRLTPIVGPRGRIWRTGRDVLEQAGGLTGAMEPAQAAQLLERLERLASALQRHHSEYDGAIYPLSSIEEAALSRIARREASSDAQTLLKIDPIPPGARFTSEEITALGSTRWAEPTHSLDEAAGPQRPFVLPPSRTGATIISFDDDDPDAPAEG